MKALILAAVIGLITGNAFAQSPSCKANAGEKKLAGAALNSFMKKCESDAQKSCDAQAADKKIYGAAKTSFTKKCVKESVGA
jgi:hypothetical protein